MVADLMRVAVDAADLAALGFGIEIVGIGGIFKYPEAIAAEHVFPARVGDAARIRRIAHPGTVVLQAAINVVRVGVVGTDMVELRDWKIDLVLPAVAAVFTAPKSAVVPGDDDIRVLGINPYVVKVAVAAAGNVR